MPCNDAFALCTKGLVKLTPGAVVVERVSDASDQLEGVGDGVKARVEDVDQSVQ